MNNKRTKPRIEIIKVNETMIDRIKDMQDKKNLTNKEVAGIVNISLDKYKNIRRGKNQTIEDKLLHDLASLFGCTRDFLACESNIETTDKEGRNITFPIDFDDVNSKLDDISQYLRNPNHYQTLNSIHLILCRMPAFIMNDILASLNTLCKNVPIAMLMDRKDELSKEKLAFILDNLTSDNPEYTKMTIKLTEADIHLGKKRNRKALNTYLEIIYHGSLYSRKVVIKAIDNVKLLQDGWSSFPNELKPLSNYYEKISSSPSCELPSNAEQIISSYLETQKIQLMKRSEYTKLLAPKY